MLHFSIYGFFAIQFFLYHTIFKMVEEKNMKKTNLNKNKFEENIIDGINESEIQVNSFFESKLFLGFILQVDLNSINRIKKCIIENLGEQDRVIYQKISGNYLKIITEDTIKKSEKAPEEL